MKEQTSYRDSHKSKGDDYHSAFKTQPHRNMVWRLEKRVLTKIVRHYFPDQPPRHLDFASGTGRILSHLHSQVSASTALDVSESMLSVARRNCPSARFVEGDITREELLVGEKFDLITAFRFFPNAEAALRREALDELVARLSERGRLVFNNHINNKSLLYWLSTKRRGTTGELRGMNDNDVSQLVRVAGLTILKKYPMASAPLGETRMRFARAVYWFERFLAKVPGISPLAQNVIYVCGRTVVR